MKQLIITSMTVLGIVGLAGCGGATTVAPSQNSALNNISNSNAAKEKPGYMQRGLDSWLEDDWTPTLEKDEEIREKYMEPETSPKSIDASTQTNQTKTTATAKVENKQTEEVKYVEKKDKGFTLQEYVDKSAAYMKAKGDDDSESNVKKMESMPVIGK